MLGSSFASETWVDPPPVVSRDVHASATADLRCPPGATKRQREFAAGRRCAARALRQAGAPDLVVPVGVDRKPIWPHGFVGSITHTTTFAWAVAARAVALRSVGIDSEPIFDESSLRDAARMVLDPHEWQLAESGDQAKLATIVFSAKESLFKCLNPCVGEFFEFADVRVDGVIQRAQAEGTFDVQLLRSLAEFPRGRRFAGRYVVSCHGVVHTAVELPT